MEHLLIRHFRGPQLRGAPPVQLLNRTGGIKARNYTAQQFQEFMNTAEPLLGEVLRRIGP